MRSSIIWRAGLAAMLCPVLCGSAYAHAFLKSAVPASGSTLKTSPGEVDITFTENVEPRFSHVVVQDATGTAVNAGAIRLAAGNPAQLIAPLKPTK
jgi:methionine-rich copper-binding protein CopC